MSLRRVILGLVISCLAICVIGYAPQTALAATGDISTVAGGGINEGGPASNAGTLAPWTVFVDNSGNIYVFDWGGSRVQRIDAATGIMNTVVGNGLSGRFLGESGEGLPADQMTISSPT
jgi:hypothetical protein